MRINATYRYPVKGLSAEPLERVLLVAGECLPQDRRFAIARASTVFDPRRPEWLPKTSFYMLMRDERLAQLRTVVDATSDVLSVACEGREVLRACLTDAADRARVEAFLAEFLETARDGRPRLVEAPGHTFADARRRPNAASDKYVSLVNLSSIAELERAAGMPLDPIRFRANFYFDDAPAWTELEWVGRELAAGGARLRVVSTTTRCAATTVNPATARRDMEVPALLQRTFGHNVMGVYAEVIAGGEVRRGDRLAALRPPEA